MWRGVLTIITSVLYLLIVINSVRNELIILIPAHALALIPLYISWVSFGSDGQASHGTVSFEYLQGVGVNILGHFTVFLLVFYVTTQKLVRVTITSFVLFMVSLLASAAVYILPLFPNEETNATQRLKAILIRSLILTISIVVLIVWLICVLCRSSSRFNISNRLNVNVNSKAGLSRAKSKFNKFNKGTNRLQSKSPRYTKGKKSKSDNIHNMNHRTKNENLEHVVDVKDSHESKDRTDSKDNINNKNINMHDDIDEVDETDDGIDDVMDSNKANNTYNFEFNQSSEMFDTSTNTNQGDKPYNNNDNNGNNNRNNKLCIIAILFACSCFLIDATFYWIVYHNHASFEDQLILTSNVCLLISLIMASFINRYSRSLLQSMIMLQNMKQTTTGEGEGEGQGEEQLENNSKSMSSDVVSDTAEELGISDEVEQTQKQDREQNQDQRQEQVKEQDQETKELSFASCCYDKRFSQENQKFVTVLEEFSIVPTLFISPLSTVMQKLNRRQSILIQSMPHSYSSTTSSLYPSSSLSSYLPADQIFQTNSKNNTSTDTNATADVAVDIDEEQVQHDQKRDALDVDHTVTPATNISTDTSRHGDDKNQNKDNNKPIPKPDTINTTNIWKGMKNIFKRKQIASLPDDNQNQNQQQYRQKKINTRGNDNSPQLDSEAKKYVGTETNRTSFLNIPSILFASSSSTSPTSTTSSSTSTFTSTSASTSTHSNSSFSNIKLPQLPTLSSLTPTLFDVDSDEQSSAEDSNDCKDDGRGAREYDGDGDGDDEHEYDVQVDDAINDIALTVEDSDDDGLGDDLAAPGDFLAAIGLNESSTKKNKNSDNKNIKNMSKTRTNKHDKHDCTHAHGSRETSTSTSTDTKSLPAKSHVSSHMSLTFHVPLEQLLDTDRKMINRKTNAKKSELKSKLKSATTTDTALSNLDLESKHCPSNQPKSLKAKIEEQMRQFTNSNMFVPLWIIGWWHVEVTLADIYYTLSVCKFILPSKRSNLIFSLFKMAKASKQEIKLHETVFSQVHKLTSPELTLLLFFTRKVLMKKLSKQRTHILTKPEASHVATHAQANDMDATNDTNDATDSNSVLRANDSKRHDNKRHAQHTQEHTQYTYTKQGRLPNSISLDALHDMYNSNSVESTSNVTSASTSASTSATATLASSPSTSPSPMTPPMTPSVSSPIIPPTPPTNPKPPLQTSRSYNSLFSLLSFDTLRKQRINKFNRLKSLQQGPKYLTVNTYTLMLWLEQAPYWWFLCDAGVGTESKTLDLLLLVLTQLQENTWTDRTLAQDFWNNLQVLNKLLPGIPICFLSNSAGSGSNFLELGSRSNSMLLSGFAQLKTNISKPKVGVVQSESDLKLQMKMYLKNCNTNVNVTDITRISDSNNVENVSVNMGYGQEAPRSSSGSGRGSGSGSGKQAKKSKIKKRKEGKKESKDIDESKLNKAKDHKDHNHGNIYKTLGNIADCFRVPNNIVFIDPVGKSCDKFLSDYKTQKITKVQRLAFLECFPSPRTHSTHSTHQSTHRSADTPDSSTKRSSVPQTFAFPYEQYNECYSKEQKEAFSSSQVYAIKQAALGLFDNVTFSETLIFKKMRELSFFLKSLKSNVLRQLSSLSSSAPQRSPSPSPSSSHITQSTESDDDRDIVLLTLSQLYTVGSQIFPSFKNHVMTTIIWLDYGGTVPLYSLLHSCFHVSDLRQEYSERVTPKMEQNLFEVGKFCCKVLAAILMIQARVVALAINMVACVPAEKNRNKRTKDDNFKNLNKLDKLDNNQLFVKFQHLLHWVLFQPNTLESNELSGTVSTRRRVTKRGKSKGSAASASAQKSNKTTADGIRSRYVKNKRKYSIETDTDINKDKDKDKDKGTDAETENSDFEENTFKLSHISEALLSDEGLGYWTAISNTLKTWTEIWQIPTKVIDNKCTFDVLLVKQEVRTTVPKETKQMNKNNSNIKNTSTSTNYNVVRIHLTKMFGTSIPKEQNMHELLIHILTQCLEDWKKQVPISILPLVSSFRIFGKQQQHYRDLVNLTFMLAKHCMNNIAYIPLRPFFSPFLTEPCSLGLFCQAVIDYLCNTYQIVEFEQEQEQKQQQKQEQEQGLQSSHSSSHSPSPFLSPLAENPFFEAENSSNKSLSKYKPDPYSSSKSKSTVASTASISASTASSVASTATCASSLASTASSASAPSASATYDKDSILTWLPNVSVLLTLCLVSFVIELTYGRPIINTLVLELSKNTEFIKTIGQWTDKMIKFKFNFSSQSNRRQESLSSQTNEVTLAAKTAAKPTGASDSGPMMVPMTLIDELEYMSVPPQFLNILHAFANVEQTDAIILQDSETELSSSDTFEKDEEVR